MLLSGKEWGHCPQSHNNTAWGSAIQYPAHGTIMPEGFKIRATASAFVPQDMKP